jgi:hypothetical protein
MHGGNAPQVRAKAAVRAEVAQWVVGDQVDDPGETLLRLITQASRRVDALSGEIERQVAAGRARWGADFSLQRVLIGERWISDADGEAKKAGEYIRGLIRLEGEERDRLATFASKALAADVMEKQAAIADRHGEMLAELLRRVVDDERVGLSEAQRKALVLVLREAIRSQAAIAGDLT